MCSKLNGDYAKLKQGEPFCNKTTDAELWKFEIDIPTPPFTEPFNLSVTDSENPDCEILKGVVYLNKHDNDIKTKGLEVLASLEKIGTIKNGASAKLIDITGVNLVRLVQKVYEMSVPLGLGLYRYTAGPLTALEAKKIVKFDGDYIVNMDYVKGRACKFRVIRRKWLWLFHRDYISNYWHDHTDKQLETLLRSVWPTRKPFPALQHLEHGVACACEDCKTFKD